MTAFGEDAYLDIWTKAAALLQSIVKDHPLVDGNKRLGWLASIAVSSQWRDRNNEFRNQRCVMIRRFVLTIIVCVSGTLVFPSPSQASPERVEVCHASKADYKVLTISAKALPAHLRHGDVLPNTGGLDGSCAPVAADYSCPFVAELSLVDPIEIQFDFTSPRQDLDVLGIGADGGEGNFDWSIVRDAEVVAFSERDDHIAFSWYADVEPGEYSLLLAASDPAVPQAQAVRLNCFG